MRHVLMALILSSFLGLSDQVVASDSISYSGRLVNANGSPVTGQVNLKIEFAYSGTPAVIICTQDLTSVDLTNGVFHIKLGPNCTVPGATSLSSIFSATPFGESVGIRVTDVTHSKTYSYQALHSMPFSLISHMAKQIEQMGATNGQVLAWNNTTKKWEPTNAGAGNGSVTSVDTGTGLTGGPITNTGTISIAPKGVTSALIDDGAVTSLQISNGTIVDADISNIAAIARSKLAVGTPNYVLVNDGTGVMSGVAQLPIAQGGTGASTDSGARANLGLGTAATRDVYGTGDVITASSLPSIACLPTEKLLWLIPGGWSCATDADSADASKLPLTGGTLTGNLVMNTGTKITIPDAPTAITDAANKGYIDSEIALAIAGVGGSQWTTSGSNIYYNTANGNVGIGTTNPTHKLQINNTTNASATSFNVSSSVQVSTTADQFGSTVAAHYGTVTKNSGFAIYRLFGGLFSASNLSGSATEVIGVSGVADGRGTRVIGGAFKASPMGTIDNAYGVEAVAATESSTANSFTNIAAVRANIKHGQANTTMTDAKVLDVSIDHTGSGAITNAYGIYMGALGGAATVNRWAIYSADPAARSHFAGNMNVAGDSAVEGKLRLKSDNTNYVEFRAPAGLAATRTFVWPGSYGTSGHVLTTDGAGNLSWAAASGGAATLGGELSGTTASATIANNVITSAKIVDGTITGSDIADNTIPYAKLNLADNDIPVAKVNGLTTALSGKEPAITAGTSSQYWRGDKTWQTLNTAAVTESTNLYFTEPRVLATDLLGLNVTALLGPVTATDDVLSAIGKLQGQVTANKTSFDDSGVWSLSGGNVYRSTGYVSVGTATPLGALTVAGNTVNSWATGTMRFASDASANYIQSGVDTSSSSARDLRFAAYNSNIPFMTIKADGSVGIGLAAPTTKLHVHTSTTLGTSADNSAIQISSANRNAYLQLDSLPASGGSSVVFSANTSERGRILYQNATNDLTFHTNAAGVANGGERMRINSAGNVGIGTNNPAYPLHVNGISQFESYAIMKDTGETQMLLNHAGPGWGFIGNNSSGVWSMGYTNNSSVLMDNPVLSWTTAGRVGVGTTAPTRPFHVVSTGDNVVAQFQTSGGALIDVTTNAGTNGAGIRFNGTATTNQWVLGVDPSIAGTPLVFGTNDTYPSLSNKHMYLFATGRLGIGNSNPAQALDVVGNIKGSGSLILGAATVCTSAGCTATSDKRLKKNINPLQESFEKILSLKGVEYDWKNPKMYGDQHQVGFLAQDLEKVYPEVVVTDKETGMKSVAYGNLVAPLVEAFKELVNRLGNTDKDVSTLKRDIASVKEENAKVKAEAQKLKEENAAIKSYLCSKDPAAPICK